MTDRRAPIDPAVVRTNLDAVHQRIAAAGGDPALVTVVAVTKGFGPDAPAAAGAAGLHDLGENYAQELADKAPKVECAGTPRWHFIGQLQSNKVRMVADLVSCWQSVDRASLVSEIANRAPGARVLVQVNATGETQKGGCPPDEVAELVAAGIEAGLAVDGLMAVGVDGDDRATAAAFERVRGLATDLGLATLSMGMTGDLELGVRAGATMIRVGSALFGPRPPR